MSMLLAFIAGMLAGAFVLARWWAWRISKPEIARVMLESIYVRAHPHWLQVSKDDTRRVCPCCGWTEER